MNRTFKCVHLDDPFRVIHISSSRHNNPEYRYDIESVIDESTYQAYKASISELDNGNQAITFAITPDSNKTVQFGFELGRGRVRVLLTMTMEMLPENELDLYFDEFRSIVETLEFSSGRSS